jgi:aryl-alcohol dehydrogenase-like predicted oxidoreductase
VKLSLGTAQIGLDYGISNTQGQVSRSEAASILRCAHANGITMLDTAVSYGDSESRLGEIGVRQFDVISKLPHVPEDVDARAWITDTVRGSLTRLKIGQLYGLLLHRSEQLRGRCGAEIQDALRALKQMGLVRKTGVSIYVPAELDGLDARGTLDVVQAPLNLFDDRLVSTGWLARLKAAGTEVHVRSIFLQGVLLFEPHNRPERFQRWAEHFAKYDAWMRAQERSRLEVCVAYAHSVPGVDRVVVGVESTAQLEEIIAAASMPPLPLPQLASSDTQLLDPLVWMRR